MKSFRENPDGEENQMATKQHEREVFACNQQVKSLITDLRGGTPESCDYCGEKVKSERLHPDEGGTWICNSCIDRIGY